MHSYSIYIGISHVNQLLKLHPALIMKIREELDSISLRFGGRCVEAELYQFPHSIGETVRKTIEAAASMYRFLRGNDRELYGITVLVFAGSEDAPATFSRLSTLKLMIPDENGFWVDPESLDGFSSYLDGALEEGLFRVRHLKDAGPRLEERLPSLLVCRGKLKEIRSALEQWERDEYGYSVLLLRGQPGSGKRATLNRALQELYPDDGALPLIIPFSDDADDFLEPFIRTLGSFLTIVPGYLDENDRHWWREEGAECLEQCRKGRAWETPRDQGLTDLIHAFNLYVKAYVERRRRSGRLAYIVIDSFSTDIDAGAWLHTLVHEVLCSGYFRLVIIRDSDDCEDLLPFLEKGQEVNFQQPTEREWERIFKEAFTGHLPDEETRKKLVENCGSSLYKFFHGMLEYELGLSVQTSPGISLVDSLDCETRRTLFLIHAAAGLINRKMLIERLTDEEEKIIEGARYDGLMDFGLIREDPDGRVRGIPGGPANVWINDPEGLREASMFGKYLFGRMSQGDSIDLFRLFRYLEQWGPVSDAIAVLDRLFESLLTSRRLSAARLLLNGLPMSRGELDGLAVESLRNVVEAARLRYMLLTRKVDQIRSLLRDGTVSLVVGRGGYMDRFRLQNARYSYAVERWDEALKASREALFDFQKSGDHEGETHAHIELALALLSSGRVRDALEHFGIAHRIGYQVSSSWGVLRAATMGAVTQFLFGNLPRAERDSRELREAMVKVGRRDLWLLLTLTAVRISWEMARWNEAVALAEEGRKTAVCYGLADEESVLELWKGRSLLASGVSTEAAEGRNMLLATDNSREACAFLAESAYFSGDTHGARMYIGKALSLKRVSRRLQGEADDWSDGFFPIEGRLSDSHGPLDVLGEWIEGFDAFLAGKSGDISAIDRLTALLEKDGRQISGPFSYLYALWAVQITPEKDKEQQTRLMSRAFNDLQMRASRFDDNQAKHIWLLENPWNKRLMAEAQIRKFL